MDFREFDKKVLELEKENKFQEAINMLIVHIDELKSKENLSREEKARLQGKVAKVKSLKLQMQFRSNKS